MVRWCIRCLKAYADASPGASAVPLTCGPIACLQCANHGAVHARHQPIVTSPAVNARHYAGSSQTLAVRFQVAPWHTEGRGQTGA